MLAPDATRPDPPLLLVGTDFRSSPVALRERVTYGPQESERLLVHLLAREEIAEAFLLSTCNRTEVYVAPRDEEAAYRTAVELVFSARAPEIEREGRLYVKRHGEAARHLLRVAGGLESMVLGEPEILGQVRQAAALADAVGASGTVLRRLLRAAATGGRRARAESDIALGAVSLGYAVVELARNIFTRLDGTAVLVIGAGGTARQVTRSLLERGARRVRVANRSQQRAERLRAELPEVELVPYARLLPAVAGSDVVVASTAAPEPVLGEDDLRSVVGRRPARPLLLVDLAVPRNVEPGAGRLDNVFLHTLDSLDSLIQRNLRRRREEVPRVEEVVEQELARFRAWYRGLEAEPVIAELQRRAESIRAAELERARESFPAATHDELERLTRSLVRKILHHPSARLRSRQTDDPLPRLDLVRELFQLDPDDEPDGE